MRPGPRRPCAISKPRPSPSRILDAGTRTFLNVISRVPVRRVIVAEDSEHAFDLDARRIHRHQNHGLLFMFGRGGSVLPMKIEILQRGSPAPEDHHLRPLIT